MLNVTSVKFTFFLSFLRLENQKKFLLFVSQKEKALTKEGRERERKVVIFIKEYLDKYLIVCHSVGLTRHIVENGGKLTQELG